MLEIEYIVGIYRSLPPGNMSPFQSQQSSPSLANETGSGPYVLVCLLTEQGLLESDIPKTVYAKNFLENLETETLDHLGIVGPFTTLERLNQYAFRLCEELDAARIALYSVLEYNELLENGHGAQDFFSHLLEKGNVIENIERKKKGFFNRLFNS